jgi:hypothetical protein
MAQYSCQKSTFQYLQMSTWLKQKLQQIPAVTTHPTTIFKFSKEIKSNTNLTEK